MQHTKVKSELKSILEIVSHGENYVRVQTIKPGQLSSLFDAVNKSTA